MIFAVGILVVLYLIFSSSLLFVKSPNQSKTNSDVKAVSILVAAKNEANNVTALLDSIFKNKTNIDFEVLVVDDNSTDETKQVVLNYCNKEPRLRILSNSTEKGKKGAIKTGLSYAKYDYILQTDADCIVTVHWINAMLQSFSNNSICIGPVHPIAQKGLLNGLIRLENFGLQFLTFFTAQKGTGALANGANIGYKKQDYLNFIKSGLGANYASGDDVFFLKYAQTNSLKAVYVNASDALVKTIAPSALKEFLQQRKRWASKSVASSNMHTNLIGVGILMLNISLIAVLFLVDNTLLLLSFTALKILADNVLITTINKTIKDQHFWHWYPFFVIIYPLYLVFGLSFIFNKNYTWKGSNAS